MARTGPTTLSLPSFDGATRRLVLINVASFFVLAAIGFISGPFAGTLFAHLRLEPAALIHGQIWQLVTFSFTNVDLLGTLFGALTLWFFGAMLEGSYGSRWLYQLYLISAIGGGAIGSALSFTSVFHLSPFAFVYGPWAGIYGLYIAAWLYFGDMEILLFFVVRMKLRYMVIILILVQLGRLVVNADAFEAAVLLSSALTGYLFLKYAPRRGFAYSFSERYFALRNEYYRSKRRRAARKFEVYMKKQNRDVTFDKDGRYIDPDKDPNDKRWMN
jgi:membrane associated rhomboid family serine protease